MTQPQIEQQYKQAADKLLDEIGMKIAATRWDISRSKHVNMSPPLASLNDYLEAKQKEISILYNNIIDEFCP